MRRRVILPLALAALAALAVGCGQEGNNRNLIPAERAQTLVQTADEIQAACDDSDMDKARAAVQEAENQINELPPRVDDRLEQNMQEWLQRISRRLERDCAAEETATPEPTVTEEPTETATSTPTPTPTPTATPEEPAPTETAQPEQPGDEGDGNGGGAEAPTPEGDQP
jgi:outer membrane biosynthesis protein TonB